MYRQGTFYIIQDNTMKEVKEISLEELRNVSGGEYSPKNVNDLTWHYKVGDWTWYWDPSVPTSYSGIVKKLGYIYDWGYYWAYVYVEFPDGKYPNGWYNDNGDSVVYKAQDKYNSRFVVVQE